MIIQFLFGEWNTLNSLHLIYASTFSEAHSFIQQLQKGYQTILIDSGY